MFLLEKKDLIEWMRKQMLEFEDRPKQQPDQGEKDEEETTATKP